MQSILKHIRILLTFLNQLHAISRSGTQFESFTWLLGNTNKPFIIYFADLWSYKRLRGNSLPHPIGVGLLTKDRICKQKE